MFQWVYKTIQHSSFSFPVKFPLLPRVTEDHSYVLSPLSLNYLFKLLSFTKYMKDKAQAKKRNTMCLESKHYFALLKVLLAKLVVWKYFHENGFS